MLSTYNSLIKTVTVQTTHSPSELKKTRMERQIFGPDDLVKFRYCDKCKEVKPPRTHHCSICASCIMRMDHHCPWVGNCVGLRNHKYFLLFLMYTSLASSLVFICLTNNRNSEDETFAQMLTRYNFD